MHVCFLLHLHYWFNYTLDPCETITCNGTNAQCQVYLDKENMGKPFCACPEGLTGDPNVGCGKNEFLTYNK